MNNSIWTVVKEGGMPEKVGMDYLLKLKTGRYVVEELHNVINDKKFGVFFDSYDADDIYAWVSLEDIKCLGKMSDD